MFQLPKDSIRIALFWRVALSPLQGALQILDRLWLVQPSFVFRNDLTIRADDLDAGFGFESIH